jgi:hypothetical protein
MAEPEINYNCPLLVSIEAEQAELDGLKSFEYNGIINGKPSYRNTVIYTPETLYIYYFSGLWIVGINTTGTSGIKASVASAAADPQGLNFNIIDFTGVATFEALTISCPCPCIEIEVSTRTTVGGDIVTNVFSVSSTQVYGGYNAYFIPNFVIPENCSLLFGDGYGPGPAYLWNNGNGWIFSENGYGGNLEIISNKNQSVCPEGSYYGSTCLSIDITAVACENPCLQDRTFRKVDAIKLPKIFEEEDRGFFRCCCPFNVLADGSSDTWKNDITSAWIKLSSGTDSATATLYKNGIATNYTPTAVLFPNENNAYYWTILWADVLGSDGAGCYELKIEYNISGIQNEFTWGIYHLKPYTITNALKTARVKAIFSGYHEIEGINFTGADVADTLRFFGFIGNRQPNTEIDNLIYENREVKRVIRENLNTYEILTDPTCEEHILKLTDLYLLSENQLFISDYNAFNHSYRYQDTPVIVDESPEITYYEFSREASLKCVVSDKFKNKRTFYNG